MTNQDNHLYAFGPFVLDPGQRLLWRDQQPVSLAPKVVDTLLLLVSRAGRLVEKQELMDLLWHDSFVEEGSLTKNISVLRQTLGNGEGGREYIETIPKRGYRFVAEVTACEPARNTERHPLGSVTLPSEPHAVPASALPGASAPAADRARWTWRIMAAVTGLLALAGAWLWFSPPPPPTVLKTTQITHFGRVDPSSRLVTDSARIYFVERKGGRLSLASVPIDGGEPVPVPTPLPDVALYGISPDHSELLVGSDANNDNKMTFWLLSTAGGSPRRVGNVIGHDAAWSRDGRRIAYFSGSGLFAVNPDGSDSERIAATAGREWFSRWSPDGAVLRFSAANSAIGSVSLWEVPASGGTPHRLLQGWREPLAYYGDGETDGDWAADGRYYVFRSTRAAYASIWAMREDAGFLRRASGPVQLMTTDSSLWGVLAAGNKVFYTGDKEVRELARFDARSGQFVPYLTGVRARDVSFSRDGQWVAYVVPNMQQSVLWKSKADGSGAQQLTFLPLLAGQPRWSPDGKEIAFRANPPGKPLQIFLIPSGGGEPEAVTNSTLNGLYPDWSPAGDRLFFTGRVPARAEQPVGSIDGRPLEGTYQLDLKTRQVSLVPGAEALKGLFWSPDGRYQVALTLDDRTMMLYDTESGRWSELMKGKALRAGVWSSDGKYVYTQDALAGASQPILRVRISDRKVEPVATFEQIPRSDVRNYGLAGLAPDDSPVVSLVLGQSDIYALDLKLP